MSEPPSVDVLQGVIEDLNRVAGYSSEKRLLDCVEFDNELHSLVNQLVKWCVDRENARVKLGD
jgi:hypothetical protein